MLGASRLRRKAMYIVDLKSTMFLRNEQQVVISMNLLKKLHLRNKVGNEHGN